MVAKINYGSSLYGALAYNGEKVNEGVAKILETNKVFSPADGTHDISACMQDFMAYMPSHVLTKKPVIHISLNPHPDDRLTDEQFSAIRIQKSGLVAGLGNIVVNGGVVSQIFRRSESGNSDLLPPLFRFVHQEWALRQIAC